MIMPLPHCFGKHLEKVEFVAWKQKRCNRTSGLRVQIHVKKPNNIWGRGVLLFSFERSPPTLRTSIELAPTLFGLLQKPAPPLSGQLQQLDTYFPIHPYILSPIHPHFLVYLYASHILYLLHSQHPPIIISLYNYMIYCLPGVIMSDCCLTPIFIYIMARTS